jgi:hypothetical protein
VLEEEVDDGLLVCCVNEGAKEIFSENHSSLLGSCLVDIEMKCREFVKSFERHFLAY